MPKPYRRRKGKNGPYVGNYRATIDGRDINLGTKDAHEATARARLAKQGKWPPLPAAVDAVLDAVDPGRQSSAPPPPQVQEDSNAIEGDRRPSSAGRPGEPSADTTTTEPPTTEPEPLADAMRAAAEEATGRGGPDPEVQAEQENHVNTELAAVMAELGGGASGADLLDGICDGGAAFLLWAERKALELGINWTLARRKSKQRLVTKPMEEGALMRKALRVGLKGAMVQWFPDFSTRLTPGWAIAIGMVGGAGQALMTGELVNKETGAHVTVAEAVAQSREPAGEQAPQPSTPPAS